MEIPVQKYPGRGGVDGTELSLSLTLPYVLTNIAFSGAFGVQMRIRFTEYIHYNTRDLMLRLGRFASYKLNKYGRLAPMRNLGTKLSLSNGFLISLQIPTGKFKYSNSRPPKERPEKYYKCTSIYRCHPENNDKWKNEMPGHFT